MVWSPLAGGLLSGKYGPGAPGDTEAGSRRANFDFPPVDRDKAWACVAAMRPIAEKHGVSVAGVALAWLLAKPQVMSVIVGAKTLVQLDQNLAAVDIALDGDDLAALEAAAALAPEYPGWMVNGQNHGRPPAPFTSER